MAPIEITFNKKTKDIEQKITVLKDGEEKAFHFEKPLHRAFSVKCDENQRNPDVAGNIRTWSTVPYINATPPPGEDIILPNVPRGSDVVFKNSKVRIELGKGIKATVRHIR